MRGLVIYLSLYKLLHHFEKKTGRLYCICFRVVDRWFCYCYFSKRIVLCMCAYVCCCCSRESVLSEINSLTNRQHTTFPQLIKVIWLWHKFYFVIRRKNSLFAKSTSNKKVCIFFSGKMIDHLLWSNCLLLLLFRRFSSKNF